MFHHVSPAESSAYPGRSWKRRRSPSSMDCAGVRLFRSFGPMVRRFKNWVVEVVDALGPIWVADVRCSHPWPLASFFFWMFSCNALLLHWSYTMSQAMPSKENSASLTPTSCVGFRMPRLKWNDLGSLQKIRTLKRQAFTRSKQESNYEWSCQICQISMNGLPKWIYNDL